ncbi:3'-5' exonuclease [Thioalkalivibrio thiocyanodenitrificans]|uniref:3'-5' exonuclease n=1 Tax=Thioalkalivibrio thiocyanodenitrificans TaxID=243063 RepID=UPI00036CF437|nr:3'-5' exonuclease [Thioalkalivibrio thiocyanodenitrificans]
MAGDRSHQSEAPTWHEYFRLQAEACTDPVLKRFYHAGLPPEDALIKDVPLMALDFETTGMDAQTHSIVSIGMVPFSLRTIRPAAGCYWIVKPSNALLEESVAFHGITHSEIERAPELDSVLDDVLDALAGHLVVVHYRDIERPFLDRAVMDRRGEHCLFPLIDTMTIEARWEREGRLRRIKRFFGIKPPSIRLSESRARYGLPAYSAHHAKVDAMATAELFQAQVARHYSPETPVSSLWV